jgi:hypothetical protein
VTPHSPDSPLAAAIRHRRAARLLLVPAAPLIVYFAVRPLVGSDAAGLAIAGALPAAYTIALALLWRRVDLWAAATTVTFALGCLASLLANGSSLPLKLHEAAVTFLLGLLLLGAVLAGRPLPVGRIVKAPPAIPQTDRVLGLMIGAFVILHSLLHLTLALTLSTATYLVAGRIVNWATIGVGALCLYRYLRHLRQQQPTPPSSNNHAHDRHSSH